MTATPAFQVVSINQNFANDGAAGFVFTALAVGGGVIDLSSGYTGKVEFLPTDTNQYETPTPINISGASFAFTSAGKVTVSLPGGFQSTVGALNGSMAVKLSNDTFTTSSTAALGNFTISGGP